LEAELAKGQEIWREFPPLTPKERRELLKAQERLFYLLPKDKDIPLLLQEISRLGRDYNLTDVSFNTSDAPATQEAQQPGQPVAGPSVVGQGATTQAVVPQAGQAEAVAPEANSGPIDSFPVKMAFAGDYREIAYFLEGVQKLPRLVTLQSVKAQRAVPQVAVEVVLRAYYQKGELPSAVSP
jgi:Tfp pilus assembly protein PilO